MATARESALSTHGGADEPGVAAPQFDGWRVARAGGILLALQSALILQAFGQYAVVLREQFGWSKTTVAIAYSFNRAESGLLGPMHGAALGRFGTRRVMRVGAGLIVVGFAWFSLMSTPRQYVASFFVIAVGAGLGGFLTVNSEVVKWFDRRRTRALTLVSLGLATGGLAVPALVYLLERVGWRTTALASGFVLGGLTFVFSYRFGSSPAESGQRLDGIDDPGVPTLRREVTDRHLSVREALRTRAFWMISFGHASALLVVGAVIAHLSLYLTSERGYSLREASIVVGTLPIAQLSGIVAGGYLGDRASKRWLCAGAMLAHMLGLLSLAYAETSWMIWAFVALHGFAWGVRGPLMSAIRADYFGATAFGQLFGLSSVILMFGIVGGPLLAGVLADSTGSYRTGFTILALVVGSASALFVFSTPPKAH